MEPEVADGTQTICTRIQVEAVKLVRERGISVKQAAHDLNVHENVLRSAAADGLGR